MRTDISSEFDGSSTELDPEIEEILGPEPDVLTGESWDEVLLELGLGM